MTEGEVKRRLKNCLANKFSPLNVMCSVALKTFTNTSSPTV